jgi:Protein of unknown function (DUF3515)
MTINDAEPASPAPRPSRRPALIATAIAVPVTVLLALAFTAGRHPKSSPSSASSSSPSALAAPVSVAASSLPAAAQSPCEKVSEKLPITLNGLAPRAVFGPPFVVAWGNPSVLYRCGVARPAGLTPGSGTGVIDTGTGAGRTVEWFPVKGKNQTVWTSIDRAVYIEVTVPAQVQGGEVISALSGDIASALPAVCQAFPANPPSDFDATLEKSLCVNRR